ncbi:MAG: universal stress protein [Chloroflexi bacterium]|nr:universal stress protein [Chloroflexota bacterium]
MYKKILAPLDGSKLAECVLPHLESIVKGCGAESVVLLRAVADRISGGKDFSFSVEEWRKIETRDLANARAYLSGVARGLSRDGARIQEEVIPGDPAQTIVDYAGKNGVDLIVIASHGRSGISRWAWGSVADKVMRSAATPVLMVRPEGCGGL